MSLATLFGKLQEYEMELQRLNQNEETKKRKRSIALKASSSMQEEEEKEESNDEEDFSLSVKKFHKFVKNKRMERTLTMGRDLKKVPQHLNAISIIEPFT